MSKKTILSTQYHQSLYQIFHPETTCPVSWDYMYQGTNVHNHVFTVKITCKFHILFFTFVLLSFHFPSCCYLHVFKVWFPPFISWRQKADVGKIVNQISVDVSGRSVLQSCPPQQFSLFLYLHFFFITASLALFPLSPHSRWHFLASTHFFSLSFAQLLLFLPYMAVSPDVVTAHFWTITRFRCNVEWTITLTKCIWRHSSCHVFVLFPLTVIRRCPQLELEH